MAVAVVELPAGSGLRQRKSSARGQGRSSRPSVVRATAELAARVGFHGLTVAELSVVAGIGPRTFYNHFADVADVFFEVCWQGHEDLRLVVQSAYDGAAAGADAQALACVEAVVAFVQADPVRARVWFVQGYSGGPAVAALRAETIGWLIGLLAGDHGSGGAGCRSGQGRRSVGVAEGFASKSGPNPRRLLAEVAIGGIGGVLYSRVRTGELDGLDGLVPSFVDTLIRALRVKA